jgi:hypothetical protein
VEVGLFERDVHVGEAMWEIPGKMAVKKEFLPGGPFKPVIPVPPSVLYAIGIV